MNKQEYTFHPDLKSYEKQKAILIPAVDRRMNTESCWLYTDAPMCIPG